MVPLAQIIGLAAAYWVAGKLALPLVVLPGFAAATIPVYR